MQQIDTSGIEIEEINALEREDLVEKYDFAGVPTLVLLDGETVIKKHTGLLYPEQLNDFINGGNE
jgi:thioredoxin-related protein